jgi:hypothetical protein
LAKPVRRPIPYSALPISGTSSLGDDAAHYIRAERKEKEKDAKMKYDSEERKKERREAAIGWAPAAGFFFRNGSQEQQNECNAMHANELVAVSGLGKVLFGFRFGNF